MLDGDFDKQMAALEQNQRKANESYASVMERMAADLTQMSTRFETEMKSGESASSPSSSVSKGHPQQQQQQQGKGKGKAKGVGVGMREQMDRGEAVREVKHGRMDVGGGKKVV